MICLKLKKNISLLVFDGNWSLNKNDILIFKKVGIKSTIKRKEHSSNEYIHSYSYLLLGFEYSTYKDLKLAMDGNPEYHMVWHECNSVDTLITLQTGAPYYHINNITLDEILKLKELDQILVGHIKFQDIFDDVSISYNREDKLNKILNND